MWPREGSGGGEDIGEEEEEGGGSRLKGTALVRAERSTAPNLTLSLKLPIIEVHET